MGLKNTTRKSFKRRMYCLGLFVLYVVGSYIVRYYFRSEVKNISEKHSTDRVLFRKLLSASTNINSRNESGNSTLIRCTKPSIEEFPRDFFTQKQRRYGAVLLHIISAVYMFIALAFVCDDYFVSSLDKICERLDLSDDVAGATFMAAGSSAPELFTAVIGVFITKGDVGLGTIVGSAVFNILVILSLCALFSGQVVQLTWWPICRDSLCYMLSITALILTIYDGKVVWYESLIMILMYFGYIILMKFNPIILHKVTLRSQMRMANSKFDMCPEEILVAGEDSKVSVTYIDGNQPDGPDEQIYDRMEMEAMRRRMTWKELGLKIMLTDKFSPSTRFRAACLIVIHRQSVEKKCDRYKRADCIEAMDEKANYSAIDTGDIKSRSEDVTKNPFIFPRGSPLRFITWLVSLPLLTILYFTIPDCRKPKWESWYPATFLLSIFWIMIFSYIMVWMVCVVGFTIGVPDVIMGITFLAAGTSIPDAISSLIVAREGLGDMAVSNSIGSNIFDILIGLAFPWFLKSAIVKPGGHISINSRGMVYSVALLFASVILTVITIHFNKWRLDRKLGVFLTLLYLGFIVLSACIEFNLFGFVNFPVCAYRY